WPAPAPYQPPPATPPDTASTAPATDTSTTPSTPSPSPAPATAPPPAPTPNDDKPKAKPPKKPDAASSATSPDSSTASSPPHPQTSLDTHRSIAGQGAAQCTSGQRQGAPLGHLATVDGDAHLDPIGPRTCGAGVVRAVGGAAPPAPGDRGLLRTVGSQQDRSLRLAGRALRSGPDGVVAGGHLHLQRGVAHVQQARHVTGVGEGDRHVHLGPGLHLGGGRAEVERDGTGLALDRVGQRLLVRTGGLLGGFGRRLRTERAEPFQQQRHPADGAEGHRCHHDQREQTDHHPASAERRRTIVAWAARRLRLPRPGACAASLAPGGPTLRGARISALRRASRPTLRFPRSPTPGRAGSAALGRAGSPTPGRASSAALGRASSAALPWRGGPAAAAPRAGGTTAGTSTRGGSGATGGAAAALGGRGLSRHALTVTRAATAAGVHAPSRPDYARAVTGPAAATPSSPPG